MDGSIKVVVIGSGISGLTVAYELAERSQRLSSPVEILCLESSDRAGGNIRTEVHQGFTCESGPNGFLDNAQCTLTLVRRLGLGDRLLPARKESETRYVFRAGALRRIPTTPRAFMLSSVLSVWGRLRLCAEPLIKARAADGDESVFDFASRRIGRSAASILVDAMVSGIFAGDARQLSLGATFPKMLQMEQEHGGLVRAMLAKRRENQDAGTGGPAGPGGRLTSFRDGMEELPRALAAALGDKLQLGVDVESVSDMGVRGVRVHLESGPPMDVDAVVVATPAWHAAKLFQSMDVELASRLEEIPAAPLAVVHLGYREGATGDRPQGFGFLVPRRQNVNILGALWSSDTFDHRAPNGGTLFTIMIGGAHDREAVDQSDDQLIDIALRDIDRCMGIKAIPYLRRVVRHHHGIPQYSMGHLDRVSAIEHRLQDHPGTWICGNSYHGVSVNACIEEAPKIAEDVLEHLARRTASRARSAT